MAGAEIPKSNHIMRRRRIGCERFQRPPASALDAECPRLGRGQVQAAASGPRPLDQKSDLLAVGLASKTQLRQGCADVELVSYRGLPTLQVQTAPGRRIQCGFIGEVLTRIIQPSSGWDLVVSRRLVGTEPGAGAFSKGQEKASTRGGAPGSVATKAFRFCFEAQLWMARWLGCNRSWLEEDVIDLAVGRQPAQISGQRWAANEPGRPRSGRIQDRQELQ